ncbi:MAG: hypothetical protein J6Z08_08745 [Elusimicrobiales bacterium]|jgi:ppGpp synthetase/RelA/SpoT-type nucleotidyltranferase|nr:hypothetical protein [Elusimicrobiales bacterium]
MDPHSQLLLEQFKESLPVYRKLKDIVLKLINDSIRKNGLFVSSISSRIKTAQSLSGKLELKGMKYRTITDITDLLGIRVITFYSNEVDKIAALAEQIFDIDWDNSVDKRKMYSHDRFGYMSLHYICRIPENIYSDPEMPELNKIPFELQMRTVLQHAWASIYHDTGYKTNVEVPVEYLRALSRLAGLLEIADEEFKNIRTDLDEYRRKIRTLVKNGSFEDIPLNGDSFRNYTELGPFDPLNEKIASINNAEIEKVSIRPYFEILVNMGIKTIGELDRFLRNNVENAYQLALHQIGGTDLDIISSNIGIQNLCIVHILKQGRGLEGLEWFYDQLYGKQPRNAQRARRTLQQAKKLAIIKEEK